MDETTGEVAEETASPEPAEETESSSQETASGEEAEGAAETASAATTQDDEPEEWKFLLGKAKVAGDLDRTAKEAIGKEHAQLKSAASSLSKENKTLKAKLADLERAARSTKPDEPEEVPADLQAVDSTVKALETAKQSLPEKLNKAAVDLDAKYEALIEARVSLKNADEIDKAVAEARLTRAELAYDKAVTAYDTLDARARNIDKEINQAKKEREGIKRHLDDERARQAKAEEDREQFNQEFPERFDGYIATAAEKAGIHKDPTFRESVRLLSNELAMVTFWRMDQKGVEVADEIIPQVAAQSLKRLVDFGEAYHRLKLQKVSTEKLKVTESRTPSKKPDATPGNGATGSSSKPLQSWRDGPEVKAARERLRRAGW